MASTEAGGVEDSTIGLIKSLWSSRNTTRALRLSMNFTSITYMRKPRPTEVKVHYTVLLWFQSPNSFHEGRDLIHFLILHRAECISSLIEIVNKWQKRNISLKIVYISNHICHLCFLKNYCYIWLCCANTHPHTHLHTQWKEKAIQTARRTSLKYISDACVFESAKQNFKHVFFITYLTHIHV